MDDSVDWKEARGGQGHPSSDDDEGGLDVIAKTSGLSICENESEGSGNDSELNRSSLRSPETIYQPNPARSFSCQQLNLSLRRNIVALADSSQHKSGPSYAYDNRAESFVKWLENGLVSISPTADLLLFAGHSPERTAFIAKLRKDQIDQYMTKPLEIPLDYDEQVTSLLCLPIMSSQKTAVGRADWTALVIGLSSGYVRFYTEQSVCLLSLKYCDEPVFNIRCQTLKNNSNARSESHFPLIVDELLITYRNSAIVLDGLGLYENLRISKDEVLKYGLNYEPSYNLSNLPSILNCQRWKFDSSSGALIQDADLFGTRRTTVFDSMRSDSINFENTPAKTCARTLGVVGQNPFLSCYRESKESNTPSYTELIGSLFSLWSKPQPTRAQLSEITSSSSSSIHDRGRLATCIVASPDKRLAVVTDKFGRVLLVDVTNWLVVRIWKGYRSAQCGWIEAKKDPARLGSPHASFLIIYAPRRGLLEVWSTQRGPRVAAFNVGKNCRLLYSGYRMLNMRINPSKKDSNINLAEQCYSSHCYLLNAESETVFSIELPYTYSLYNFGDLKSRDRLLIGELVDAIRRDSEVGVITEILYRIALPESIYDSVHKITVNLEPTKIVTLMENLINKTMRNYDNHSGGTISKSDRSIIEICKRTIRLCDIFNELSGTIPCELTLPDVNHRLIDEYEEHPQEINELSEQLGWSQSEVLRYLSLLALERSYRKGYKPGPWPSSGEPLTWLEFVDCFDLKPIEGKLRDDSSVVQQHDKLVIRLREFDSEFLSRDQVVKTALFIFSRLTESFHKALNSSKKQLVGNINNAYNYLEPSSRLALLFQFWLSTKLCYDWKLWVFLQHQVGQISDELKVIAMSQKDDAIFIETWKRIYHLILESDNIYSALIATASIRSDTLRTLEDNEKREKIDRQDAHPSIDSNNDSSRSTTDWECLCVDAERMSLLSQQLENIFILSLLLRYSVEEDRIIEGFRYRISRLSVANIHRAGPTVVSELVAQWAVQSSVNPKIFTKLYGVVDDDTKLQVLASSASTFDESRQKLFSIRQPNSNNFEEHVAELLHHTKAAFPSSLEPDVILMNCVWEFCRDWMTNSTSTTKTQSLMMAHNCLSLLSSVGLAHRLASIAYKTFFQRTFERLVALVETSSTIVNVKSSRIREKLIRKELNIDAESLDEFVQFCCDLTEFMLQTCSEGAAELTDGLENDLNQRLLAHDSWWSTPIFSGNSQHSRKSSQISISSSTDHVTPNSLVAMTLSNPHLLDVNRLVELNRLASLMDLIFKLNVIKAYPLSLIGEDSRQLLQIDLHSSQTAVSTTESRVKSNSLTELRQKFARKCILNIVAKITEGFEELEDDKDEVCPAQGKQSIANLTKAQMQKNKAFNSDKIESLPSKTYGNFNQIGSREMTKAADDDWNCSKIRDENNEAMLLFANLLSLANEWHLNCDDLHLELVFEMYRCNHDKLATQVSIRILDQQTLAEGLMKIASQRVLVLFGLSPHVSGPEWRRRNDRWSLFQPNVASWLKSVQQEEMRREIACLSFPDTVKSNNSCKDSENPFGLQIYALHSLRRGTQLLLENVTNHLEGQAARLAYDLLQLLQSQLIDKLLEAEATCHK